MTCIQVFYLGGARSYADLASRSGQLTKALEHYHFYLNPPKVDKPSRFKSSHSNTSRGTDLAGKLVQPETEVRRYLDLV